MPDQSGQRLALRESAAMTKEQNWQPPQPNMDLINPGSPNYNPEAYHRQMQLAASAAASAAMTKEQNWHALEAIVLSGQMTDADLDARLRDDAAFADWLRARAKQRQERR